MNTHSIHPSIIVRPAKWSFVAMNAALAINALFAVEVILPEAPSFSSLPEGNLEKLADLPTDASWTSVSPDGRTIMMLGRKGSRHAVFVNGAADKVYDEIYSSIQMNGKDVRIPPFTTDGSISLFLARRGTSYHLVANGSESPAYSGIIGFWPSPVGNGYVLMAARNNQLVVHRDGVDLPPVKSADGELLQINNVHDAAYSPDGRRFVYLAEVPDPSSRQPILKWVLNNEILDAMPDSSMRQIDGRWVFGPEDNWACLERSRGVDPKTRGEYDGHWVNFNGKKGPKFGGISDLQISADGKHVAYRVQREPTDGEIELALPRMEGENDDQFKFRRKNLVLGGELMAYRLGYLFRAVLDHKEVAVPRDVWDKAVQLVLGPQGQLAVVYECAVEGGKMRPAVEYKICVDGKISMDYESHLATRFLPDGSKALSFVTQKQMVYVLENAEETDASYRNIDVNSFVTMTDGKNLSFSGISVDGKPIRQASDGTMLPLGSLIRSADGKREIIISAGETPYGAAATFHNLTVGDKTYKIEGEVVEAILSPDGSRVACTFMPGAKGSNSSYTRAWVDGSEIPPLAGQYSATEPHFSPDGKHFAYTATISVKDHPDKTPGASGHGLNVRVIDGRPGPAVYLDYKVPARDSRHGDIIKDVMYPTIFEADGSVGYFARYENALWRVSLSPESLASMPDIKTLAAKTGEEIQQKAAKVATEQEAARKAAESQAKAAERFHIMHKFGDFEPGSGFVIEGPDGRLYGGEVGGRFDLGQLFSIGRDGTDYKVLRSFEGPGEKGVAVNSLFFDKNGLLYGTTKPRLNRGDPECAGTIFRHDPAKGTHENLYICARKPLNGMMDAIQGPALAGIGSSGPDAGKLYGLSSGVMGHFVFGFDSSKSTAEIIHDGEPGASTLHREGPKLLVRSPDWREAAAWKEKQKAQPQESKPISYNLSMMGDRLYSIFEDGGRGNAGKVVSLNLDGSDYKVAYDFAFKDPVGAKPHPWLIDGRDGLLYGVTSEAGDQGEGAVFVLKPDGSECRVLCPLNDKYNNILAFTARDGAVFLGTHNQIWHLPPGASEPVPLHVTNGMVRSLVAGDDGNLYGTTTDQVFSYKLK